MNFTFVAFSSDSVKVADQSLRRSRRNQGLPPEITEPPSTRRRLSVPDSHLSDFEDEARTTLDSPVVEEPV